MVPHAARPGDIRRLQLDDVDLGDRRITVASHVRQLDDLSLKVIKDYLVHRRGRWPSTANPHLFVAGRTAYDTRPVTSYYINNLFRGHKATLDRLRVDRWPEEALNGGPDPLHLAAVFGISTASPIRACSSPDPRRRRVTTMTGSVHEIEQRLDSGLGATQTLTRHRIVHEFRQQLSRGPERCGDRLAHDRTGYPRWFRYPAPTARLAAQKR
jgi:hypothetical protein